jgi:hypothetical protein
MWWRVVCVCVCVGAWRVSLSALPLLLTYSPPQPKNTNRGACWIDPKDPLLGNMIKLVHFGFHQVGQLGGLAGAEY